MFKDLKYYKELSEQLEKEIEFYESSYENFEKAIDLTKKMDDLTEEQVKIGQEFASFCKNEGFSKKERVVSVTYPKIKEAIVDRVKFLKEQKEVNDKMLSLYEELDKLKNKGELSESDVENIKKEAEEHYDVGTEKYNQEVSRRTKKKVAEKIEQVNNSIETTKKEEKSLKKENGLAKVVSSAFGPAGNVIYNAYAKVHNLNVDLRKKRLLNLVVKGGMVVGYAFLCASLHLTGLPMLLSLPVGVYAAYKTIANTFKEVPAKLPIKEKFVNLSESWFRFKKSRGLGENLLTNELYKDIDFSKYESKTETEDVEEEDRKDEKNESIKAEEKEVNPVETPIVESNSAATPAEALEEEPVKKDAEGSVEVVSAPASKSANKNNSENKTEGLKYDEENKKRLLLLRDTIKLQKGMNYSLGAKCESMDDVKVAFERFSSMLNKYEKGEFFAVNSDGSKTFIGKPEQITKVIFGLLNSREFLAKNELNSKKVHGIYDACNNMIFNDVPQELLEIVNRDVNYRKTFGVGRETKKNNVTDMTTQSRNDAFNRIMNLIYDESMLDKGILGDIYKEKNHYNFTDSQLKEIENALKEREEHIVNRRRGK